MDDFIRVCLYCAETMPDLTEEQVKAFGRQECCGFEMTRVSTTNLHAVLKSLDKLRIVFEKELVKDFGCDQYVK